MKTSQRLLCCALAVVLSSTGWAQEIVLPGTLTASGETFEEVVYVSHDDAKLKVQHGSGIANLLLSDLPADLQKTLGFDPDKATAALANEQAVRAAAIAEADAAASQKAAQERQHKLRETATEMAFDVQQVLGSDLYVIVCKRKRDVSGSALSRIGGGGDVRVIHSWTGGDQYALLTGHKTSVAEGERIETKAFDAGVRSVEINGHDATLRVYQVVE